MTCLGDILFPRPATATVPDHHVRAVVTDQDVGSAPDAIDRLDPRRPLTWISATSDIELPRVEGVHGSRHLTVVLPAPPPADPSHDPSRPDDPDAAQRS